MVSVNILRDQEGHKEIPAVHREVPMGHRGDPESLEVCVEGKAAPVDREGAGAGKATGKTNIKSSFSA